MEHITPAPGRLACVGGKYYTTTDDVRPPLVMLVTYWKLVPR